MNSGKMNQRITIQKKTVSKDSIGRQQTLWNDYFKCWCTATNQKATDNFQNATEENKATHNFYVRYCSEISAIENNTQDYRIVLNGYSYDIVRYCDYNYAHSEVTLKAFCVGKKVGD